MYHLERNRHWVVLAHYRASTLALIAAPLLAAEAMVWTMAVRQRWAGEKLEAYRYWFLPGKARHLRERRRAFAARRRCSDRDLLAMASGRFLATEMSNPLIDRLANPASAAVWWALRRLLRR
jgi:hypothetical protein